MWPALVSVDPINTVGLLQDSASGVATTIYEKGLLLSLYNTNS